MRTMYTTTTTPTTLLIVWHTLHVWAMVDHLIGMLSIEYLAYPSYAYISHAYSSYISYTICTFHTSYHTAYKFISHCIQVHFNSIHSLHTLLYTTPFASPHFPLSPLPISSLHHKSLELAYLLVHHISEHRGDCRCRLTVVALGHASDHKMEVAEQHRDPSLASLASLASIHSRSSAALVAVSTLSTPYIQKVQT